MDGRPGLNQLELFHRQTARKKFPINTHRSLIFRKIYMEMRLVMLTVIGANHFDYDVIESA